MTGDQSRLLHTTLDTNYHARPVQRAIMSGDIEKAASTLVARMQKVMATYAKLGNEKIVAAVARDLDGRYGVIDGRVVFVFTDLEDFKFVLSNDRDPKHHDLTVFGQGDFMGFMAQATGHAKWLCGMDNASPDKPGNRAGQLTDVVRSIHTFEDFHLK